ncbi:pleckstrin homology domain-containing family A member 8-like isoform X2 [Paramormyrops kingsleyae]|uniref:pleckstrin homology domain-containing family A member 8-like isoform X2 n=1 Tax=Paramormyrops kingsleyae TaxID=1676925 RepID=UPI000CD661D0|nr:pleckstrin homology domain-containing family A member 8-like isoform X2 [Paramormyrops kingsleyae]
MEGILYKWTNYLSGWQPRWFVLEGGTLSYYDSEEDAWKGCKGSIKVCVCEIQVHASDLTRLDLTIPGEQYFYLKALNAAERQKWLVALGTAKACHTDNRTKREKELQETTKALKTKMSELRLYCDLLLQQVNRIQGNSPSADAVEDDGTMLKSTCRTFLKTLNECMVIADRAFSQPTILLQTPPGSPTAVAIKSHKVKTGIQSNQHLREKKSSSRSREGRVNPGLPADDRGAAGEGLQPQTEESSSGGGASRVPEGAGSEPGGEWASGPVEKMDQDGSPGAEQGENAAVSQQLKGVDQKLSLTHDEGLRAVIPDENNFKGVEEMSSGNEVDPEQTTAARDVLPSQTRGQEKGLEQVDPASTLSSRYEDPPP